MDSPIPPSLLCHTIWFNPDIRVQVFFLLIYIGLAKKFIQVFHVREKPEPTFWPTQYIMPKIALWDRLAWHAAPWGITQRVFSFAEQKG